MRHGDQQDGEQGPAAARGGRSPSAGGPSASGAAGQALACSAALSSIPGRCASRASTAPVHRVAQEQQPVAPDSSLALTPGAVGQRDLGAGGDVEPGLDDAVVAEGDADAGVGAEQAALADADALGAAAGQGAHDRGAGADVGAVTDDDTLHDPALDHGRAQRAGVEVAEALVHDRGAAGQVGAEPHPVGVGDPHAGRHDVVGHPGELVDPEHLHRARLAQPQPGALEALDGAGAGVGPHDVGQHAEDAVEVDACWARRDGARAGAGAGRRRGRRPVRRRGRSPRATTCWRTPRRGSSLAAATRSAGAPYGSSGSAAPRAGLGYQVSRTVPSSVRVASPYPHALRSVLMGASLGEPGGRAGTRRIPCVA